MKENNFICHSGGCPGADIEWETQGEVYGIKTIAYSFPGHKHCGKNPKILNDVEMTEGYESVLRANKALKRNVEFTPAYIKGLLIRNWFQVKNSEAVFAIVRELLTKEIVAGGTGWAVQMAVDCQKPVFVYLQDTMGGGWFRYMPVVGFESLRGEIPKLTKDFAGIGTREINDFGKLAIKEVYKNNFIPA